MRFIGIVGSRRRDKKEDCCQTLEKFRELYDKGDIIVSGGCPEGGDRFAEVIALVLVSVSFDKAWAMASWKRKEVIEERDAPIILHIPNWKRHGRGAGFVRNRLIAIDCTELIAVVATDRKGGTEHTIGLVKGMGKPVHLIV